MIVYFKTILKAILDWVLKETEEELYMEYQISVVDCHPFDTPPPLSFEEWKEEHAKE